MYTLRGYFAMFTEWHSVEDLCGWQSTKINTNRVVCDENGSVTSIILAHLDSSSVRNLPSIIGQLSNLQTLILTDSHFSGSIPQELFNLPLQLLLLDSNNFSGEMPEVAENSTLHFCSTQGNLELICPTDNAFCCQWDSTEPRPTKQENQTPKFSPTQQPLSSSQMIILVGAVAFFALVAMFCVSKFVTQYQLRRDKHKFKPLVLAVPKGSPPEEFHQVSLD